MTQGLQIIPFVSATFGLWYDVIHVCRCAHLPPVPILWVYANWVSGQEHTAQALMATAVATLG